MPGGVPRTCSRGTWKTTSPGLLKALVSSRSGSHGFHVEPTHASHTYGGLVGSTPTPDTRQSTRSSTAHDGTALSSPTNSASPGLGWSEKHRNSVSPASLGRSVTSPLADTLATRPDSSEQ